MFVCFEKPFVCWYMIVLSYIFFTSLSLCLYIYIFTYIYRYHFHIQPFHVHCPSQPLQPLLQQQQQSHYLLPQQPRCYTKYAAASSLTTPCMPARTWRSCRTTNGFLMTATYPAQMCSLSPRLHKHNISVYDTLV